MSDSITILPTTSFVPEQTVVPIVGEPAKGAGYYGSPAPVHTVQYVLNEAFVGMITMQGTLLELPSATDWTDIPGSQHWRAEPTAADAVAITFTGNYVWIRAVVEPFTAGTINRIQYSHT